MVAIGGGWLALRITGSLNWLFAALALGLIVYGVMLAVAVRSGAWFGQDKAQRLVKRGRIMARVLAISTNLARFTRA